jgi:hypothetical protein
MSFLGSSKPYYCSDIVRIVSKVGNFNMIALTNMAKVFFITVLIITGIVVFLFLTLFIAHNYRKTGIFRTEFNGIDFDFDKERKDFMSRNKLYFF